MELRTINGREICVALSAFDRSSLHALLHAALQGTHVVAYQGSTETYAGIVVPAGNCNALSAEGTLPVKICMGAEPVTAGGLSHAISVRDEIKKMKSEYCYASASAHYTIDNKGPAVILSLPDCFEMGFEMNRELSPEPCRLTVVNTSKYRVTLSAPPLDPRQINIHVTTEASRSQGNLWRNFVDPNNPEAIRAHAKRLLDQLQDDCIAGKREEHKRQAIEYATAIHEALVWILDRYGDEDGWLASTETWCHGYSTEFFKDLDGETSLARRRLVYNLNDDSDPAYCVWQPERFAEIDKDDPASRLDYSVWDACLILIDMSNQRGPYELFRAAQKAST